MKQGKIILIALILVLSTPASGTDIFTADSMAGAAVCGNNTVEAGEACDDSNMNGDTCSTAAAGFKSGTLRCQPDCSGYDISACTPGNTINAASCSQEDVQSAIESASEGDTIAVPDGSCTWPRAVQITKPLTIMGAGSGPDGTKLIAGTVLNNGFFYITGFTSLTELVRITGFDFNSVNFTPYTAAIKVQNNGISLKKLRIDHSEFHYGYNAIIIAGSNGVIEHNTFYNPLMGISFTAGTRAQADASWETMAAGTADALFIEDNEFIYDADYPASYSYSQESIGTFNGGKLVVRYNHWDATNYPNGPRLTIDPIMTHGNADGGCGGVGYWEFSSCPRRGQSVVEVYNNTMVGKRIDWLMIARGSANLIHDNTVTLSAGYAPSIKLREEEYDTTGVVNPPRAAWPAEDQVHNTFIWNNAYVWKGIPGVPSIRLAPDDPPPNEKIKLNRDYFLHAPQATGGKETFVCANGVSACNGAANSYPTDGVTYPTLGTLVFSAEGPNAYYPYTPYTYPHPLTTNSPASGNILPTVSLTAPTNGVTFSAPATISITANAFDSDGSVTKVEFYNGAALVGADNSSPYSFTWNDVAAGPYSISAKAIDNMGASATSGAITVIVSRQGQPLLDDDLDGVPNAIDNCPRTAATARSYVNIFGCALPIATKFDIKPDFNSTDINGMQNLELGISQFGKVTYANKTLLLVKISAGEDDRLNLDADLNISQGKISLDQNKLPQLNSPATITLYNTSFTNPKILRDGTECTNCNITSYDKGAKTLVFTVPGF
ncbi:MAG TPA: hypothetical protein HA254_05360 [Candidatus Diapherotrites archaeon]|uniref:Uncharacterized protein n=1 Tax=Candidatus Iainarchaeum sp. TaxID=3101447 RepID=A0A7J4J106_9ARCH|nr:MAG: Chitinase [Candidatus Saccharibacteria bacterium GW2011_GWA2_46_10]HIH10065.1 hypothetical protein [Candidatus Diapherotrites archaeon]